MSLANIFFSNELEAKRAALLTLLERCRLYCMLNKSEKNKFLTAEESAKLELYITNGNATQINASWQQLKETFDEDTISALLVVAREYSAAKTANNVSQILFGILLTISMVTIVGAGIPGVISGCAGLFMPVGGVVGGGGFSLLLLGIATSSSLATLPIPTIIFLGLSAVLVGIILAMLSLGAIVYSKEALDEQFRSLNDNVMQFIDAPLKDISSNEKNRQLLSSFFQNENKHRDEKEKNAETETPQTNSCWSCLPLFSN